MGLLVRKGIRNATLADESTKYQGRHVGIRKRGASELKGRLPGAHQAGQITKETGAHQFRARAH